MGAKGRNGQSKRWSNFGGALNVRAEQAQAALPTLLLLFGIGLVNVLPPKVSRPFFDSVEERQSLAARYGSTLEDGMVYVVTTEPCHDCVTLIKQLQKEDVPFQTVSGTSSPLGMALYKQSINVWGEKNFPQVLIGLDGVEPNMPAIRRMLGRTENAAE